MCPCVAGSIVVDGEELHEEDLRLMYTFDQTSGSATQYEAHSDAQVTTHTHPNRINRKQLPEGPNSRRGAGLRGHGSQQRTWFSAAAASSPDRALVITGEQGHAPSVTRTNRHRAPSHPRTGTAQHTSMTRHVFYSGIR